VDETMMNFGYGGGWMFVLGGFLFIVFWAVIISLIIWAIRKYTGSTGNISSKSPLDIAKERYAKGEITKEQFEQLKKDLTG
jgi:putative membrane protein